MNKVFLLGNVGQEPETKPTMNGFYTKFSIGVTEYVKGEKKTMWMNVTCFGKLADNMSKMLHKGTKVLVEGRLNVHQQEDSHGKKHTYTSVTAHNIQLLSPKKDQQPMHEQTTVEDFPF